MADTHCGCLHTSRTLLDPEKVAFPPQTVMQPSSRGQPAVLPTVELKAAQVKQSSGAASPGDSGTLVRGIQPPAAPFSKLTHKPGQRRENRGQLALAGSGTPPGPEKATRLPLHLHFILSRSGIEKSTPDLWQGFFFFSLKIRRWEGENDQRWRCPKAAALNWRVHGVSATPPRGSPGPLRGAATYLFSL